MTFRPVDRHGHRPAGPGSPPANASRHATPAWTSFATGARLGWAIESNWTDPLLFAIYSVARPVGAALVLVAIVWLISGGGRPDYIGFLIVGSACWTFVGGGMSGFVWAILISYFVFFMSFAVNMWLQYKQVGKWRDYLFGEKAYIILSLSAKSLLAWWVFSAVLAS